MNKETDLSEFEFKYVNIVDKRGKKYNRWYCDLYESAEDNEDDGDEESIGIIPNKDSYSGTFLYRSEIVSIELAE